MLGIRDKIYEASEMELLQLRLPFLNNYIKSLSEDSVEYLNCIILLEEIKRRDKQVRES